MNFSCAICCSRFQPSDDVFSTRCGHLFHFPCLSQWLERSSTCPQCRERTSSTKIHRLYFNVSNNDTIVENSAALQEQIDNLEFRILTRDTDVKHFREKSEKLEKQMVDLRKLFLNLENEVAHKDSAIHALKEQAKYYKQSHEDGIKYKQQAELLRTRLNDLKDVQTILESTNEEADEMASATNDASKLAVYVSALKRELTTGTKNRREYKMMIRQLKNDLNSKTVEINGLKNKLKKIPCLEEAIQRLENENRKLKKREENCEESLNKSEANSSKTLNLTNPSEQEIWDSSLNDKPDNENEENCSFNSRFKMNFLVSDDKQKMKRLNSGNLSSKSILAKKPRLTRDPTSSTKLHDECYASDGLGGFAKIEQFPKSNSAGAKKKTILNVKLRGNLNNQNKIDDFIDLTK